MTVLCINKDQPEMGCNGKCQLMKKIEEQQQKDYNALRIAMEEYPVGFVSVLKIKDAAYYLANTKRNFWYEKKYVYTHHQKVFRPPTA